MTDSSLQSSSTTPKALFDDGTHRNLMLPDFGIGGMAVQANQHLIVHGSQGMILDPGGHKVYSKALSEVFSLLDGGSLRYIFLSHQDPDIVAAINGWLMTTEADAYVGSIWTRFVAHFGLDSLVEARLKSIPDEGMRLDLDGSELILLPAHFLHSVGNYQVYDPVSRILYSGDLGASLGQSYTVVPDFQNHIQYMKSFHQRYMCSNSVMRAWAKMVDDLDIEAIAPQHGALFLGRDMVTEFIDWCANLICGVDLVEDVFRVPQA